MRTPEHPMQFEMQKIGDACATIREEVERSNSADDVGYLNLHEQRFRTTAARLMELLPRGAEILDVGSHYLQLSSMLSLLGFRVSAVDVPAHASLPFVAQRAARFGVANHVVEGDGFVRGEFVGEVDDRFDAVLFCEILEHITFNPVPFWRRIHGLLRTGGMIHLTTPNSLKLLSVLGAAWNLVAMKRIGLNVKQILQAPTFGHHWKEYSAGEITEYFSRLSPDFRVRVRKLHYGPPTSDVREALGPVRTAILQFGNATGFFADNLEAVITLPQKTPWRVQAPTAG